ncbi:MAG: hypothetical protein K2H72_06180 [Muribaculaceae bacterium]|nr:hypothetical protein [Muribaculaceae bacterium]
MNKKLLLGAALLVGMGATFTSCVDSTESPSVTNIRDAKAEQLKSIAELNRALAEKELILANADKATQEANQALAQAQAAYLAAQAAHEQAQADYLAAQARLLDAQSDTERAKLEYELKLMQAELDAKAQELKEAEEALEYQKSVYAIELQKLQNELEFLKIGTATAQHLYDEMVKAALKAEEDAEKTAALEAAKNIKKLINKYNKAAKDLVDAKVALAQDQMALARLEAGLENEKNIINDAILELQDRNKMLQQYIAYYNSVINTYKDWAGEVVTYEMWDEAYYEAVKAQVAVNDFAPEVDAAQTAYYKANNALTGSEYSSSVLELLANASGNYQVYDDTKERSEYYSFDIDLIGKSDTDAPADCRGVWALKVSHWQWGMTESDYNSGTIYTYTPVFDLYLTGTDELENGDMYDIVTSNYNLLNDGKGVTAWLDCKKAQVKNQTENNAVEFYQSELEKAQKYLETATTNLAKAKTTYNDAVKASDNAETAKDAADAALTAAQDNVEPKRQAYLAAYEEYSAIENPTEADDAKLEAALAALQNARQAVTDAYEAYNEAEQNWYDAIDAENDADQAKYNAIKALDYAELWVDAAQKDLNRAEAGDSNTQYALDLMTNLVNTIIDEAATNEANITANNEASKTLAEKSAEYMDLLYAFYDNLGTFQTYDDILWEAEYLGGDGMIGGNVNANSEVASATNAINAILTTIEANEVAIEQYKADLAKLDSSDAELNGQYYDDLYRNAQALVEKDQIDLATKQQLFDIAKAELDAALAEQQK